MAGKKSSSSGKRGRDAGTGEFVDQKKVKDDPDGTVNETVKKKGKKGK
jgi:hypothetical protein